MTTSLHCQRWIERQQRWRLAHPGDPFNARHYDVAPISDAAAASFIAQHHYLGTYPAAAHRFGLLLAGQVVGVAVFGIPTSRRVLTNALPDLEPYRESIELSRLCLLDAVPGNGESWFVARCFRDFLLPAGVKGVVSFADPCRRTTAAGAIVTPGHAGYVYQALGSVYTGRGTPRTLQLLPDGHVLHPYAAQKIRSQTQGHAYAERQLVDLGADPLRRGEDPATWLQRALRQVGARPLRHRGCHRYVFALGRNRRERERITIVGVAQPYPKAVDA